MWIFELIIIGYIVYSQIRIYRNTRRILKNFKLVFPDCLKGYYVIDDGNITCSAPNHNEVRDRILNSINSYLRNNRNSKADFYLIKDIVDRNCDSEEEEIQTQVPVPLYYGLAGTMLGIVIGVLSLYFSGTLTLLLNASVQGGNGSNGIENLLVGVALAMISSFVGVVLTTHCSLKVKETKKDHEKNKHGFLSWMQANLLPVLATDAMSAFSMMTENLASFNEAFAQNSKDLKDALSVVGETTKGQTALFERIKDIRINEIATANIKVYEKLKDCTEEIGLIGEQLKASRQYLQKVTVLTDKLDVTEERTRLVEELANYFMKERSNIGVLSAVVSQSIGEADTMLRDAAAELKESVSMQYRELTKHLNTEREHFEDVAGQQQSILENVLHKRVDEFNRLSDEMEAINSDLKTLTNDLKELGGVNSSLNRLISSINRQNDKLDKLADIMMQQAKKKKVNKLPADEEPDLPPAPKKPFWQRLRSFGRTKLKLPKFFLVLAMIFIALSSSCTDGGFPPRRSVVIRDTIVVNDTMIVHDTVSSFSGTFVYNLPCKIQYIHPELPGKAILVFWLHGGVHDREAHNLLNPQNNHIDFQRDVAYNAISDYLRKFDIKAVYIAPLCHQTWKTRCCTWIECDNEIRQMKNDYVDKGIVDGDRVYVAGCSDGATGVWDYVTKHANWFAAGMSFSGGNFQMTQVPMYCSTTGVDMTAKVSQLNRQGGRITYQFFPNTPHGWDEKRTDYDTYLRAFFSHIKK